MPKGEKSLGGFKVVLETSVPACLCASLCLPVPVAYRRVFDARHNFTERGPAGFQIPSGISDVYLSYSSILTRMSGLGCGLIHTSRAARNRVVSWASFIFPTCWVRGDLLPSVRLSLFSRHSMGPCSLLSYKVISACLLRTCFLLSAHLAVLAW